MKKLSLLLILMAVSVTYAVAADIDTKAGNTDLIFSFGGLSNLDAGTYLGGIGARYYFQDDMAIRPQISFNLSSVKNKIADPEEKVTGTGFGLSLGLEKHVSPMMKSLSPYLGAAAGFNYLKVKNENPADEPNVTEIEQKMSAFNVGLLAGFEWGFTEGLALGGEYNIGVTFGSTKETSTADNVSVTTSDNSGYSFGVNTASLMLTVHW